MEGSDVLLTTAEVMVAFAGFSAIVVLFRRRDEGDWEASDAFRYQAMLRNSLIAVLLATLPFPLQWLGVPASVVWSIGSLLVAAYAIGVAGPRLYSFTRLGLLRDTGPGVFYGVVAGYLVVTALQLLNVFAIHYERELAPFLAGVWWLGVVAGIHFFRLVAVPLPRSSAE